MSMLLPRSYSTGSRSGRRDSLGQAELELAQEPDLSNPQFRSVEVQVEPEEDVPNNERENEAKDKPADPEDVAQPPLDPEAKYEQNLRKAQEEWARRRKAGYEDYGAEMAKDAKIWRVYVNETDRADEELVDGWHKSLDVLLKTDKFKVFAALFSAISTAFVSISSQSLQQNPSDTSAQTLLVISQTLLTMSSGGSANSSSSSANQASSDFKPSHPAVVVNGLWFLSLSLSVAVSLIAMLAKEWCHAFMSGRAGETYERARLRQHRWNEIERLKMMDVLTLLPLLMHLALLLFAVGLCIYLWDINIPVAIPVVVITSIFTFIYASTVIHSLTVENCPYTTASSKLAKSYIESWFTLATPHLSSWTRSVILPFQSWVTKVIRPLVDLLAKARARGPAAYNTYIKSWITMSASYLTRWVREPTAVLDMEPLVDDQSMDVTTSQMLSWLLRNCHDSNITSLVIQSLAGAEPWLPRLPLLENDVLNLTFQGLDKYFEYNNRRLCYYLRAGSSPDMASLYLRALSFLLGHYNGHGFLLHTAKSQSLIKSTWSRDFYPRRNGGLAFGLEDDGQDFRIESFSESIDTITFWRNFSLAVTSEADPQVRYLDMCQDAAIETIEQHLGNDIVIHPAALSAMIRQMTNRLCLPTQAWEGFPEVPYRLCILLLRVYVHSDNHDKHQDLHHAVAVALGAAVLNFGTFPGWTHPPDHTISSRAAEFVAYHNTPRSIRYAGKELSPRGSKTLEITRLLEFGLLGLLELPLAYIFTRSDLETWVTAFNQVHDGYFADHVPIHSIPQTFTTGAHTARAASHYVNTYVSRSNFTSQAAGWMNCFSALCLWNLKIQDDAVDDHRAVHSALLRLLCTSASLEQQRCCAQLLSSSSAGCSKSCLESIPSSTLSMLLAISLSENKYIAPVAMRELWSLTNSMLSLEEQSPAIESLLQSLVAFDAPVPTNINEIGLLQRWFPHIQTMCAASPRELISSGILGVLKYYYYETDHYLDRVVLFSDERDGPEEGGAFLVANLFDRLEIECNSAIALEEQAWKELPFDLSLGEDGQDE
ncbi:hypothetical protein FRC06_010848 [Ceratobasidium sp. 370]|nr:hypothetical protein FRC06_010848 [Ceratobasidium sp. 370]